MAGSFDLTRDCKKDLKILMIYGYAQSGPVFRSKCRALEAHLKKTFQSYSVNFYYPTGPLRLDPTDVPGCEPSDSDELTDEQYREDYAWCRRFSVSNSNEYLGLDRAICKLVGVLHRDGPFDGVIGFSQGAAIAAILAALREPARRAVIERASDSRRRSMQYSASIRKLHHIPFKFGVYYSGYRFEGPRYQACYEDPLIQIPALHFVGSLDPVVDEALSWKLTKAWAWDLDHEGRVVRHPGTYYLPCGRIFISAVSHFISYCIEADQEMT